MGRLDGDTRCEADGRWQERSTGAHYSDGHVTRDLGFEQHKTVNTGTDWKVCIKVYIPFSWGQVYFKGGAGAYGASGRQNVSALVYDIPPNRLMQAHSNTNISRMDARFVVEIRGAGVEGEHSDEVNYARQRRKEAYTLLRSLIHYDSEFIAHYEPVRNFASYLLGSLPSLCSQPMSSRGLCLRL
jgi:hypothetical protein